MEMAGNAAYLLLGSNLGDRHDVLVQAIKYITLNIGSIAAQSSVYETEPWGKTDQPGFLNLALKVITQLSAIQVLERALAIEKQLGRVRYERWGSRVIDIDIIFYNDDIIQIGDQLTVPHPEMHNRNFVLEPLVEIAPGYIHPEFKRNMRELYESLNDKAAVKKYNV